MSTIASAPLLLAFGNPTVDLTLEVSAAEIAALGLASNSELSGASQETKAAVVKTVAAKPQCIATPGGAALNAVRVAAWAAPAPLRAAFIGAVGDDANARLLTAAMQQVGVAPLLLQVSEEATGVCVCLVDAETKHRSLAVLRGAAGAIQPTFLQSAMVAEALASASMTYVTSFVLTTPPRAACAAELAAAAWSHGAQFALNLSSVGLLAKVQEELARLLPQSHFVFGNTDELRAFALLKGWATEGVCVLHLTQQLADLSSGAAVITDGADGTLVAKRGGSGGHKVPVPKVPMSEIVDTNGCGDAFVGGFLSKAVLGASVDECVEHGHHCAGLILRQRGCSLERPIASIVDTNHVT